MRFAAEQLHARNTDPERFGQQFAGLLIRFSICRWGGQAEAQSTVFHSADLEPAAAGLHPRLETKVALRPSAAAQ